jgi:CheY-like chemotaxis protein
MSAGIDKRPIVLLVEDIEWIRTRMKSVVERYGCHVIEAKDEDEAISAAEHNCPKVILTEEEFPAFRELTARVREHPGLAHIPIVIVNPDAQESTRYGDAIVLTDFDQLATLLLDNGL